jgi:uncharacterized membrane protein
MLREQLINKEAPAGTFRWRSHEISRIEGLSDAVFGFAITLLVVSLEVPKTFNELLEVMHGFGAFAICFTLLFFVWYNQYKFFRRYGLKDTVTVVLNGALLFVVLFYVYPLKFLFTAVVDRFTGGHGEVRLPNGNVEAMMEPSQIPELMLIFGIGYLAVFAVFVLLYLRAYKKRQELELSTLEIFDTVSSVKEYLLHCSIAIVSISFVLIGGPQMAGLAGMIYMLTGVVMTVHGWSSRRRRKSLEQKLGPTPELESA